jgi:hypothetical protein
MIDKTNEPYPRLLKEEPDLNPNQVWAVLATAGQDGIKVLRDGVVIADTAEQAMKAVERSQWTPLAVLNETALNVQISHAEMAPAYVVKNMFGQPGSVRFACMFSTSASEKLIRIAWVLAADESAAEHAWPHLGATKKPTVIFKLSDLVDLRDRVRHVRVNRCAGAMTDARQTENQALRVIMLARERAGAEAWEDARKKFAQKMAGL